MTNFFSASLDHFGTANYVVSSVADSFNHLDDAYALSLREVIDLANENDDTTEEIWLPAWNFVLTRERTGGIGTTDTDIAFGDLDISDSLRVRGVDNSVSNVRWRQGVIDAVFDLLGDYDGNGLAGSPDYGDVEGYDYILWSRQNGQANGIGVGQSSADGNDDGEVDGEDLVIWQDNYGNTLDLFDLNVILA